MVAQEIQNYNDETKFIYLTQLDEFMKKHKIKIGMDKLRLCYNVINDTIISELETERPQIYELYDFTLYRIEGKHYNDIYAIIYDDVNEDGEIEPTKLGEVRFNLKSQEDDKETTDLKKVWVYVENQILYDESKSYYLSYMTDHLGLELNNLTTCEIYVDTTKLYRSEIRFANEKFREFLDKYCFPLDESLLFNKGFQWCIFEHFFNSIIRFKRGDENIPLDLLVM